MQRTPEPELMDAPEQALAYAQADFSVPNQFFVNRFLDLLASTPARQGRLIDLGCGPGDICVRLAQALPDWTVTGLDAGPNMLALAERAVAQAGLSDQIDLKLAKLPGQLPNRRYAAVVSNSLLHHLPDPASLWQSVAVLAAPGSLIQVMDLHRPDSEADAHRIVDEHAADAPAILREDFFNSLLAAYTLEEVSAQLTICGLKGLQATRCSDRHWLVQGRLSVA